MSQQPGKRPKIEVPSLSPWERLTVFKSAYGDGDEVKRSAEDEIFKKRSYELFQGEEYKLYPNYCLRLAYKELTLMLRTDLFDPVDLIIICNGLGELIFNLLEKNLTAEQQNEVIYIIKETYKNSPNSGKKLLRVFGLLDSNTDHTFLPKKSDGSVYAPSEMTRTIQYLAEKKNQNAIFPYPFGVTAHFPVFICHPMFIEFLDILHDRGDSNSVVSEWKLFMNNNEIALKMDKCLSKLIMTILDCNNARNENELVLEVIAALKEVFPEVEPDVKLIRGSENTVGSDRMEMDAVIFVGTQQFPLVVIEAKNNSYSMNAVLQGLQYYGIMQMDYIDNDPVFLMTIDKGIMYLYGVAKVNRRIVCSCLLSLEFTSYAFNINDFRRTLYRTFSALAFFHKRISDRLLRKPDQQHKEYSYLKSAYTLEDQPYPAIFSVQGVKFSFKNCKKKSSDGKDKIRQYFQPCVYLVETGDGKDAVLKITYNYDIDSHKALQTAYPSLVPKVIGYEKICDQYHLVLMEYLDNSTYRSVFEYLIDPKLEIDRESLNKSLSDILEKFKALGIVHGDFRSGNILAKLSNEDPTLLEDFKMIDFEFSGKVGEPYPFLAMRNNTINWPDGFNSYMPRQFDHDKFMLDQI